MEDVAQLLNALQSSGLVQGYALFGALAQMRYTDPVATLDADVLVAVIALSVGRAKDFARILALLESGSVTRDQLEVLATRHGLGADWKRFEARFPRE